MTRIAETTSALECAQHQAARIVELEAAVDASHVALRAPDRNPAWFTHHDKRAAVRALAVLADELADALGEPVAA